MIWLLPPPLPPSPLQSVSSTGDTQEERERETTCWTGRGGGGEGDGAKSYDGEKTWSSIIHKILSIKTYCSKHRTVYRGWKERQYCRMRKETKIFVIFDAATTSVITHSAWRFTFQYQGSRLWRFFFTDTCSHEDNCTYQLMVQKTGSCPIPFVKINE